MNEKIKLLADNIEKVIVGKRGVILELISALLVEGHVLVEDVPGVGKTQLAAALSRSVNGRFNRIQLTPDIMPSDITGFTLINKENGALEYRKGAAFCNFLLADEINRASPKAQSALLEAMEERQISIDGKTYPLPKPFMTLATQNPVETYGTYHLPEAQMDRFSMRLTIGYPDDDAELGILTRNEHGNPIATIEPALSIDDVTALQEQVREVKAAENVRRYITSIVRASRDNESIRLGVSPRGSIALFKAAKARAFIDDRDFITPQDVKKCAVRTLSHRIILSPKGKSEFLTPENALKDILNKTTVPKTIDNEQ
ncbi:MAG: MoxR family ATPase [Oscillospiraceae bacterium]|nr:MoxR family ATPase [Oscillospiraceae bacterium]